MAKMVERTRGAGGASTPRGQKFRQAMYDAMGEKGDEIMRPEVQELEQVRPTTLPTKHQPSCRRLQLRVWRGVAITLRVRVSKHRCTNATLPCGYRCGVHSAKIQGLSGPWRRLAVE
jgi:hypothetical protein